MKRQATLSAGLHMAQIRDDVIVLDVGTDRYSCLVGGGAWLRPVGTGAVVAEDDVLRELQSAGLVAADPAPPAIRAPVPPCGELEMNPHPPLFGRLDTAVRTLAATAAFRGKSLAQLIEAGAAATGHCAAVDRGQVEARVSAYRAILPYIPFEGLCLQRAFQLRHVLASDGQRVDWVFGVKTWPFFAHCWLQLGDLVVGDRIERVRSFTPIAVF